MQPGKVENEKNGPKPIATVSYQTYFSHVADYRHLSREELGDFRAPSS